MDGIRFVHRLFLGLVVVILLLVGWVGSGFVAEPAWKAFGGQLALSAGSAEVLTLEEFRDTYRWALVLAVIAAAVVLVAAWRLVTFPLRESNRPRNDTERWIAATHAIWGQAIATLFQVVPSGRGYPIRMGGAPRTRLGRWIVRKNLQKYWGVEDYPSLLETVEYMSVGPGFLHCTTQADRAWELCRATSLLGMAYVLGWESRKETIRRSCEVCRIIQATFSSWEELGKSFMEVYSQYALSGCDTERELEDARQRIQERADLWWELRKRKDSPYRLPWDLELKG